MRIGPKAAAAALNYLILPHWVRANPRWIRLALGQDELKRRLAFSTVAQVGYRSWIGAPQHQWLNRHSISHSQPRGDEVYLVLGSLHSCQSGPCGDTTVLRFIGKWYLLGSLEAGELLPAAVIILRSVLCAAYLLPIIRIAFFEPAPSEDWKDPGLPQRVSLIALSIGVVALGVAPGYFFELAERAAVDLLMIG